MPRSIDHESRRGQITDATRRVIARSGLEAATFQAVAQEAGISIRLVQYYFGSKGEFLAATRRAVAADAAARFGDALSALDESAPARERISAILTEMVPIDDRRRSDAIVLAAFHAASLTTPVDGPALPTAPQALVDIIAAQIPQDPGSRLGARDRHLDAELILATAAGLVQGMIAGHYEPATVTALIDRLLDALGL